MKDTVRTRKVAVLAADGFDGAGLSAMKKALTDAEAIHFVNEAYKHCKALAATGAGVELLRASYVGATGVGDGADEEGLAADEAVVTGPDGQARKVAAGFIKAIAKHRNWAREKVNQVPA